MKKNHTPVLIDVNNVQFETLSLGNKKPQIIFLNGYRMNLNSWEQVYPDISKEHGVFLYNRLGIGKSSKPEIDQDAETVVKDMHALFHKLDLQAPFLLVAHSMGGLFADLYAKTYTDEVAGVVFVDCPHPEEVMEQRKFKLPFLLKALNGIFKFIDRIFGRLKNSEDASIETSIHQIKTAGKFPALPIAVVSGQKKMPFMPDEVYELHQSYQQKLLTLSPNSKQYLCNNSGHFPQISEPDKVIAAILNSSKVLTN
jgi:pimeloyl-ACP methyl ester carboxylesterase